MVHAELTTCTLAQARNCHCRGTGEKYVLPLEGGVRRAAVPPTRLAPSEVSVRRFLSTKLTVPVTKCRTDRCRTLPSNGSLRQPLRLWGRGGRCVARCQTYGGEAARCNSSLCGLRVAPRRTARPLHVAAGRPTSPDLEVSPLVPTRTREPHETALQIDEGTARTKESYNCPPADRERLRAAVGDEIQRRWERLRQDEQAPELQRTDSCMFRSVPRLFE